MDNTSDISVKEKTPVVPQTTPLDVEKQNGTTYLISAQQTVDLEPTHAAEYAEYLRLHTHFTSDKKNHGRLIRLLDWRVLPMLFMFYLLNSLDKANAGNIKIYTFLADTKMTGTQFNLALTWYFFTYAGLEAPSK
jgi:hypothetical protein